MISNKPVGFRCSAGQKGQWVWKEKGKKTRRREKKKEEEGMVKKKKKNKKKKKKKKNIRVDQQ